MDRTAFFASIRRGLFPAGMDQSQVDGLGAILTKAEARGTRLTRLAYLLATVHHETGRAMRPIEEDLNYSSERLRAVWPSRFASAAAAAPYARNPEALANKVYGGRLGNVGPGDGWRYRGRGLPMLTGRDNYRRAGALVGQPLEDRPELMLDMAVALDVTFAGMEAGLFTGYSLADGEAVPGYIDDRKIINGTDAAALIAGYAAAYEAALRAAAYDADKRPAPRPSAPAPDPAPSAPPAGAAGLLAVLAAFIASIFGRK